MIEYIHNAVMTSAGEEITITAKVINELGEVIDGCHLSLFDNNDATIVSTTGITTDDITQFTVPAEATKGLKGRYWYCICGHDNTSYCFKQPIYFK